MAKKKSGLQTALFQWAYQSRKAGGRGADVLKSIEDVENTLSQVVAKDKKLQEVGYKNYK